MSTNGSSKAVKCPHCGAPTWRVRNTWALADGAVKRTRECESCLYCLTTVERPEEPVKKRRPSSNGKPTTNPQTDDVAIPTASKEFP